MVRLVRSPRDTAEYWHRLDEQGCSNSQLVQPDKDITEEEVPPDQFARFFDVVVRDPCPRCDWKEH